MKIAFATTDRVNVNAHFGWAQEIDVYEISESGYKFIETLNFAVPSQKLETEPDKSQGGCQKSNCKKSTAASPKEESKTKNNKDNESDDKVAAKIEALADCAILYVASIGGIPAAKLIKKGVMPVRPHSEQEDIEFILNKLVKTLKGNPPPWLRKALQKNNHHPEQLEIVNADSTRETMS